MNIDLLDRERYASLSPWTRRALRREYRMMRRTFGVDREAARAHTGYVVMIIHYSAAGV